MFQESSIEGCGVQAGATYNSHSHYETKLYSHRCWAIPAMISEIQTPSKSIISKILMDHCIQCLNSWSWRWLGCFILLCNAWFTWSCWVLSKVTWIHLDSLVGSRCEFCRVCWHQAQPGQCESCRKHFAMDQVGKEGTAQNSEYQEKQRRQ